jgi:hypothetical protein
MTFLTHVHKTRCKWKRTHDVVCVQSRQLQLECRKDGVKDEESCVLIDVEVMSWSLKDESVTYD